MSWNADAAPSRNVTASWISKSSVTRPSFTPSSVLDGHEAEEALELPGAPRELVVRERCRAESRERPLDFAASAGVARDPLPAAAATAANDRVKLALRAPAPC